MTVLCINCTGAQREELQQLQEAHAVQEAQLRAARAEAAAVQRLRKQLASQSQASMRMAFLHVRWHQLMVHFSHHAAEAYKVAHKVHNVHCAGRAVRKHGGVQAADGLRAELRAATQECDSLRQQLAQAQSDAIAARAQAATHEHAAVSAGPSRDAV